MDIFCRGVKPFPPLALPEVCFWLRIMREHALFIDLGLPADAAELKREAQHFFNVFSDLEKRAGAAGCEEDFACLVAAAMVVVPNFFYFKRRILHMLIECRLCGGCLYPAFVDHLSREAMYFLKLLRKCQGSDMPCPVDAVVSENIFWARIVADHLKYIRGLVDPSERALIAQAQVLGETFDQFGLQARDIASMLWHFRANNDLIRFEKDFRLAGQQALDFAGAAETLVARCSAIAVLQPLLADHFRREGEHFLVVLELIREFLLHCGEMPVTDFDNDV